VRPKRIRSFGFVEFGESARLDEFGAERVVFAL